MSYLFLRLLSLTHPLKVIFFWYFGWDRIFSLAKKKKRVTKWVTSYEVKLHNKLILHFVSLIVCAFFGVLSTFWNCECIFFFKMNKNNYQIICIASKFFALIWRLKIEILNFTKICDFFHSFYLGVSFFFIYSFILWLPIIEKYEDIFKHVFLKISLSI